MSFLGFLFFLEMAKFHLERCSQEQSSLALSSEVRHPALVWVFPPN